MTTRSNIAATYLDNPIQNRALTGRALHGKTNCAHIWDWNSVQYPPALDLKTSYETPGTTVDPQTGGSACAPHAFDVR